MAARLSTSALNITHLLNTWRNRGRQLLSTRARDKQASKQASREEKELWGK
jgi:hypothetical protein